MSMTLPRQNRLSTGLGPPWTAAIEPACACSNRTNGSGIYSEVPGDGGRRVIGVTPRARGPAGGDAIRRARGGREGRGRHAMRRGHLTLSISHYLGLRAREGARMRAV
jgi:hypothetical protein